MRTKILKGAMAGLMAVGLSGCMSMGGYGSGYGNGYYNDGYASNSTRYHDRCYDAYDGYDNYYADYDCYDRDDYRSRFSVNIGFGGGWYDDWYYPGHGFYMFDRYGVRRALYGNYIRYWGGRRAGYRWRQHRGYYGDYRGRYGRGDYRRGDRRHREGRKGYRDRRGVGDQIVDRVRRAREANGDNAGRRDRRGSANVATPPRPAAAPPRAQPPRAAPPPPRARPAAAPAPRPAARRQQPARSNRETARQDED